MSEPPILDIPHELSYLAWRMSVYTALEHNRSYRIGLGDEARVVTYMYRDFPEDHPAVFNFMDQETGELVGFLLEQLTELERQGAIKYLGVTLTPEKDDG